MDFLFAFFFGFEEAVADAADSMDHPGEVGEFFSDGGDVYIDGAVGDEDVGAHGAVHELVSGEDAATGGEDGGEEFEFGGGEVDGFSLDGDFVFGLVDDDGAGGEHGLCGFVGGFVEICGRAIEKQIPTG